MFSWRVSTDFDMQDRKGDVMEKRVFQRWARLEGELRDV